MKYAHLIVVLTLLIAACEEAPQPKPIPVWNEEKSTEMNRELAMEEDLAIQLYLSQHENWEVESTGSGLRFIRMKKGEGPIATSGRDAKVQLHVFLLDGTECYTTPSDEVEVFRIDKSDIETGVQEGIKKMHVGDKARLLIPSHLAHGLMGDLNKIPPLTTIIVDIELIELV